MRKIKYLLLGFSILIGLSLFHEYIYALICFYDCGGGRLPNLVILGFLLLFTAQAFLGYNKKTLYKFFVILLSADVLSYLLLPDYTDYIVPEKKIALLFFNVLIPVFFLFYSAKKNKNANQKLK